MAKAQGTNPGPIRRFEASEWRKIIGRYSGPDAIRSMRQVVVTLGLLCAALWVAHWLMGRAPWAAVLMILPITGMLTRTFIIMHDCAHGSFLPWNKANDTVGFVTGVLTFTPFAQWRREHAIHHASAGDLDHRGFGDITTLTVEEYGKLSRFGQLKYRMYRHPFVLFGIGPLHLMLLQRFKLNGPATGAKQQWNIWMTNFALVGLTWLFVLVAGWKSVFLIYYPAMYLAGAFGIWLFYVQHQFEEAYWERGQHWDYATAAITGSSHLRLPGWMNWFTGHIGLHHVHHLGPKIPNYRLKRAHEENPIFTEAPVLTFWTAWRSLRLTLWDEANKRMIGFRDLRRMQGHAAPQAG
ncbi:MAG: fatty acid desaturase [Gemmatimonadetes bacterium]|nr:fatty acid desaturase [Gemmatimonadota bacterium]